MKKETKFIRPSLRPRLSISLSLYLSVSLSPSVRLLRLSLRCFSLSFTCLSVYTSKERDIYPAEHFSKLSCLSVFVFHIQSICVCRGIESFSSISRGNWPIFHLLLSFLFLHLVLEQEDRYVPVYPETCLRCVSLNPASSATRSDLSVQGREKPPACLPGLGSKKEKKSEERIFCSLDFMAVKVLVFFDCIQTALQTKETKERRRMKEHQKATASIQSCRFVNQEKKALSLWHVTTLRFSRVDSTGEEEERAQAPNPQPLNQQTCRHVHVPNLVYIHPPMFLDTQLDAEREPR